MFTFNFSQINQLFTFIVKLMKLQVINVQDIQLFHHLETIKHENIENKPTKRVVAFTPLDDAEARV